VIATVTFDAGQTLDRASTHAMLAARLGERGVDDRTATALAAAQPAAWQRYEQAGHAPAATIRPWQVLHGRR
jgi:FMN phosphatase YigB (HAD superfamily)